MKQLRVLRKSLRTLFSQIHLVDKCLIIIMSLLLFQSAYGLFFNVVTADTNMIDVIVRTAIASIFGYFLSSNFVRHKASPQTGTMIERDKEITILDAGNANEVKNQIGFSLPDSEASMESGNITVTPEQKPATEETTEIHLQIIITTAIAIFCLLVLFLTRNISGLIGDFSAASSQATMSQFRDLVSGCIGFLIGVPTTSK